MPPVIIENAYIYYQSFGNSANAEIQPGDFVTYECRQGYILVGQKTVRCTTTGWSATPICIPQLNPEPSTDSPLTPPTTTPQQISCGAAPTVSNAYVYQSTFDSFKMSRPGDTVEFQCIPGYELAGLSRVVACLTNGRWSELPYCVPVVTTPPTTTTTTTTTTTQLPLATCGSAPFVTNARIRYQSFQNTAVVNDIVMYDCLVGYQMSGLSTIACMSSGKWTIAPSCLTPTGNGPFSKLKISDFYCFICFFCTFLFISVCVKDAPSTVPPTAPSIIKKETQSQFDRAIPLIAGAILEQMAIDSLMSEMSTRPYQNEPVPQLTTKRPLISKAENLMGLAEWQVASLDKCKDPPTVESGRVVFQTFSPASGPKAGNYVVYGCLDNYRLIGPSVVWCQGLMGGWTTTPFCILNIEFMDFPSHSFALKMLEKANKKGSLKV